VSARSIVPGLRSARHLVSALSFVGGVLITAGSVLSVGPFAAAPSGPAPTSTVGVQAVAVVAASSMPGATPGATPGAAPGATPVPPPSHAPLVSLPPDPTAVPTSAATPEGAETLWFEDTFSSLAGAFWTGSGEYAGASYADGGYRVEIKPVDLPVVLSAAAGESSPGAQVAVEGTFQLIEGPDDAEYGLSVRDVDGTAGLELLIAPGGRYALYRDNVEVFESVLAGSRADFDAHREVTLRLEIGPQGSGVLIDGTMIAQSDATIMSGSFGIALRTTSANARIVVHDYRVWQLARP
jgi:hypothetical protein